MECGIPFTLIGFCPCGRKATPVTQVEASWALRVGGWSTGIRTVGLGLRGIRSLGLGFRSGLAPVTHARAGREGGREGGARFCSTRV
jgi:hypothetical protein